MYAFLKLIRWNNLLILALMEYFARLFLIGPVADWKSIISEKEIFYLTLAVVCVAAGGYIINDYYDIKIDMLNKPERVVLIKRIHRRAAILLHICINFSAVAVSFYFLSANVALFVAFCAFVLWWYSNTLKRTAFWGNLCIAFLAFASLYMLALYYKQREEAILFFSAFAFLTTLIREILKDMEDTKGDKAFGCRTLPIVYGIPVTKGYVYIILTITAIIILFSVFIVNAILYIHLLLAVFMPLLWIVYRLYYADSPQHFKTLATHVKYIMLSGIVSMVWLA